MLFLACIFAHLKRYITIEMKRFFLFSVFVMLAFSSCKKSDHNDKSSTGSNTITANVDGSTVNFNNKVTGSLMREQNEYVLVLAGATNDSQQSMQVGIESKKPIAAGTYILSSATSPDVNAVPQVFYNESGSPPVSFTTDIFGTNVTTVTITSINNTNVQGYI